MLCWSLSFLFSWKFQLCFLFMFVIITSFPSFISCMNRIALSPQRRRYQFNRCYSPQAFPLFKTSPLSPDFKRSCSHSRIFYECDTSHIISLHFMFPCLLWLIAIVLYLKVFFFLLFYFVHTHTCMCEWVCIVCVTLLMVSGLLSLHVWLEDYSIYGCQL